MHVYAWQLSSHGEKTWIEVTLLWVRRELIAFYMILKISLIEEGASFVTLFVVRCVPNFLCFNIHFSLVSKNFRISYTPTPTRKQFLFLFPPPREKLYLNPAEPQNFQSLYKELDFSLPKF